MKTRCPRPLDEGDVSMEAANSRGLLQIRQAAVIHIRLGYEIREVAAGHL